MYGNKVLPGILTIAVIVFFLFRTVSMLLKLGKLISKLCLFQLLGYEGPAPLVLQIFIGTADERVLKPHAFYQVHRVTGKTVATPSMERMINGTKVLEIPLEPKKHMKVV